MPSPYGSAFNVQVRGVEKVQAFLASIPRGAMKIALTAVTEYIIGDASHGLKHNDPYRYVTRAAAYGQTFVSPQQRGYVMAKIRSGEIVPGQENRTGRTSDSYGYTETNNGYGMTILNPTAGAYYTRSDSGQAAQPEMVGWRKAAQVIADNINGAMRSAQARVNEWLKNG